MDIRLTKAADLENSPWGTVFWRFLLVRDFQPFWSMALLILLFFDFLVCSPFSQESVGLPIYHLDAYVYIHKIKTDFSKFFFGNFMKSLGIIGETLI